MSGCVYHPCFLSRLYLPCAHTCIPTYTRASHTLKHTVADGPANASFPCRAPRATGCICVTEAGPAATGGNGREMEKGEGKGRKGGNEIWETYEEVLRKVIAREASEGGELLQSAELLAGAVVREATKGS